LEVKDEGGLEVALAGEAKIPNRKYILEMTRCLCA